jgi:hypothetical protein
MGNFITNMGRNINRDGVIVSIVLEKLPETGETVITSLSYTPTICLSTEEARYVIYPADSASIAGSSVEAELAGSRERTLRILKEEIANIN